MYDEPYIGEIRLFAGIKHPPRGWLVCNGALVYVNQFQALFSLLGNRFGGDGRVNFALPNLYGCMIQGTDQDTPGTSGGETFVSLQPEHLPPHSHDLKCSNASADSLIPSGHILARTDAALAIYDKANTGTLHTSSISASGEGAGHNNTQPSLVLNYIISTIGNYPSPH